MRNPTLGNPLWRCEYCGHHILNEGSVVRMLQHLGSHLEYRFKQSVTGFKESDG